MQPRPISAWDHSWDISPEEARRLQKELAREVSQTDGFRELGTIAGLDLGYPRTSTGEEIGRAAVVVLRYPGLEPVEERVALQPVSFPYVPGLLSFREAPVGLAALASLETSPDLIVVDGHGRAHPRRFGIACHLGVLLDRPTIGCAKSILVGHADEPGPVPGDWTPLVHRDEVIGAVLRTRVNVKPVYVSVGHKVSLETAIATIVACLRGYRLPEPTRLADRLASQRGVPPEARIVPADAIIGP
jgi:deoxyribonuclease V